VKLWGNLARDDVKFYNHTDFWIYLLDAVAAMTLGIALHQQLQRHAVGYIILAIWLFQPIFSARWMKRYRIGPMECLWRSLTCWQRQPPSRPPTTRALAATD
jgi:uncharacterized protein